MTSTPPPPPARANTSLTNLQVSEDFVGRAGVMQYSVLRSTGGATQREAALNSSALVRYDASTQSYTVVGINLPQSIFAAANRQSGESTPVISVYEKVNGTKRENLALFNPGAANTELALTYTSYGALQTIVDKGASLDVDTAFFTFGVQTAASDMPRTGTSDYRTKIDGQFSDAGGVYALSGPSTFSANFGAGTFAFTMDLTGQNVVDGSRKSLGAHSIDGSISYGNQFSGASSRDGTYSSNLGGYFYGPAAAEMGGSFSLVGGGGVGAGAVVGKKE
ncbi:MAG TPA: transferrin-binding protein-like solute binding protein [Sphingopyxis sp.]|nr:transferrin-binding protein-like solute binding protein [Sphingopyxis sp.]